MIFSSYPDLLVMGCMVLYDIVPDFIQFMLTLSFKIRDTKEISEQLNLFLDMLSIRNIILCVFFCFLISFFSDSLFAFEVDGMMEYIEIGWLA